jgi:hypothetical protein
MNSLKFLIKPTFYWAHAKQQATDSKLVSDEYFGTFGLKTK